MRQFFQTIWWWVRVAIVVVVAIYMLLLLWNNKQEITLWYWPGQPVQQTNVVALAIASFILGGVVCSMGWALFSATIRFRRTRAERKRRHVAEQRESINRKASMLRVKPAPAPIVRPLKAAEPIRSEPVVVEPLPPEPIEVVVTPPPMSGAPTFATGSIPVEVDQVIVLTPPPAELDEERIIDGEVKRNEGPNPSSNV